MALLSVYLNSLQPQIDPSFMAESLPVGQSAPATPAAPSVDILAPSVPCSKPVPHVSKCKICEEFSANDINQLLHAVISVNPYLEPHSQITGYKNHSSRGCMYWAQ